VTAGDGARLASLGLAGDRPPGILAVHATGFCKELWQPVLDPLLASHPAVAVDQRGHGDSPPIEAPFDWWVLGHDVLAVIDQTRWTETLGVGHSSGAAALVLAELVRPRTFTGLVLIEPIVFPGPFFRAAENPMSARALRRRSTFPSPQSALESYLGRGPFARWDDDVVHRYVEYGFRAGSAGGWTLKCAPHQEAEFYRGATLHGAWERLGEVGCPVVLVGGSDSESHPKSFLRAQADRFPTASVHIVEGATHFVPMEQPDAVALLIREALRGSG
jgi:pimeloyl-ACP methyl ester carboxylesterase